VATPERTNRNTEMASEQLNLTKHDHTRCVEDALEAAETVCAQRGARLTPTRKRVLELIWREHKPVGAYDLLRFLQDERKGAAPPTVYRALEFLQEQGLIHRIEFLNAYMGCADPENPHVGHFLVCRKCGNAVELADSRIEETVSESSAALGFKAEQSMVEVKGVCADCRKVG